VLPHIPIGLQPSRLSLSPDFIPINIWSNKCDNRKHPSSIFFINQANCPYVPGCWRESLEVNKSYLHNEVLFIYLALKLGKTKKMLGESQTYLQKGCPNVIFNRPSLCQEASLEWRVSSQMPMILCANHKNVMAVPFFPICQGSNE
jgi:hypothetical protein